MWFLLDRDERTSDEIVKMKERLGNRSELVVLSRRELENYLLDPEAVCAFLREKLGRSGKTIPLDLTSTRVSELLKAKATSLREEIIRLRVEREVLRPIVLRSSLVQGSTDEKLEHGLHEVARRQERLRIVTAEITKEVDEKLETHGLLIGPGSLILDAVAQVFGVRFRKETDSVRLAMQIKRRSIDGEIVQILDGFCV